MSHQLLDPSDPPARQIEKLSRIADALMAQVERSTDQSGEAYAHFQTAVVLENQVRARTRELERTLRLLNESNASLAAVSQAAQKARADLYNALESVQEGFALFGPDDAMIMCNSRFCRQMPGVWKSLNENLPFEAYVRLVAERGGLDLSHEVDAESWIEQRMAMHGSDHAMFNVRLAGGEWLQISEYRTPAGGTAILQTDISDLIRIERAERDRLLGDQARLMRATLDHLNQGVCLFDPEGRLVSWNRRLASLVTPPMRLVRVGSPFAALLDHIEKGSDTLGDTSFGDVREWVDQAEPREPLAFDMRRPGGAILSIFAQETPDRGFVISFTDVTAERKAAEELSVANTMLEHRVKARTRELEIALSAAERANASKSRFVAAVSHDLLQPLSAAKLFVSSLGAMPLEETPRRAAQRAENALGAVEDILDALLDISRLDSGRAEMKPQPVRLDRLLAQLEEEFAPVAAAGGLSFKVRRADIAVMSDPVYLRRILQNLIGNAIRYTKTGGVLVGSRRVADGVRIDVCDTGPGIPEHMQAEIFREFRRLGADGSAAEGMGLGLAIVDRAASLLGHPLSLRSTVGRGSRFGLTLRRARSDATGGQMAAAPSGRAVGADLLVLIVENDAEMSAALALQLEAWGLSAFEARSGAGARALLKETGVSPDILLVDYALDGGETGFDAIRQIRAAHGAIPTALITAAPVADISERAFEMGVRVISKPIANAELLEFIARVS